VFRHNVVSKRGAVEQGLLLLLHHDEAGGKSDERLRGGVEGGCGSCWSKSAAKKDGVGPATADSPAMVENLDNKALRIALNSKAGLRKEKRGCCCCWASAGLNSCELHMKLATCLVASSFAKSLLFKVFQHVMAPCSQMSRLSTRRARACLVREPQTVRAGTVGSESPQDTKDSKRRLNSTWRRSTVQCRCESTTEITYRVRRPRFVGGTAEVTLASMLSIRGGWRTTREKKVAGSLLCH
jgi:hypothetical protein